MTLFIESKDNDIKDRWNPATSMMTPATDEIHLWCAHVNLPRIWLDYFRKVLSEDETLRAGRFVRSEDYNRFIVSRGLLRYILGRYLNTPPGDIRFEYNPFGKPECADTHHENPLCFNVSHSGDRVLYGISNQRHIGVDIEKICFMENQDEIVNRFFSQQEIEDYKRLPESLRREAFFNCWTRKESYIKSWGKGMSIELNTFSVSVRSNMTEESILLNDTDGRSEHHMTIRSIPSVDGYVGAVAVEGKNLTYRFWNWEFPMS